MSGVSGVNPARSADCTPFTGKGDSEGVPAPLTSPGLLPGRCAACGRSAEQAPSGRWWHRNGPCEYVTVRIRPAGDIHPRAEFIPDDRKVTV